MFRHALYSCSVLLLVACGQSADQEAGDAAPANSIARPATPAEAASSRTPPPAQQSLGASVQLQPTQGNRANGSLVLATRDDGISVSGTIRDLPPDAEFAFHIHERGDCSAPDGSSAGDHFNPGGAPHGDPRGDSHHAGDLVNIRSDGAGVAQVDMFVRGVRLYGGALDVVGRSMVVHAAADDYKTQPAGNSGARIACGVIVGI